jgi:hypothetical protein
MRQGISKKLQKQLHDMLIPIFSQSKKHTVTTLASVLLLIITISTIITGLALAQELEYPNPISPQNGATSIGISSVFFSWERFYVGTQEYTFQLSKNPEINPVTVNTTIKSGGTTYKYTGTLEYDTTYYWRVMATKPLGGYWSPVSNFRTKAAPATNNATGSTDSASESFPSSIINFLEEIGWPVVGLIAGVVIIVIIFLVFLLKPKAKPAGQRQGQRMQPPPQTQRPFICPRCGFQNSPERKFCSNCGTGLAGIAPQQPWGAQQQPTNICPACGLSNSPGQKFCKNCGTSLAGGGQQQQQQQYQQQQQQYQVYQTFTCPICGAPINKGQNPCPNCRTWLDWGA